MSKLAVIVGATGGQGSSVVKALLKDHTYRIRAITRKPSSEKAKALTARGVEVVAADFNDTSSLIKAFSGASFIFGVTDFFETFAQSGPEEAMRLEYQHGINIANAASQTLTLEHFIWSTLPDSRKISDGEYVVPHFDAKTRVDKYIKQDKALLKKTTFLYVAFYASNLFYPPLTPNYLKSAGKWVQTMPMPASTPIEQIGDHTTNVGVFVKTILEYPEKTTGGKYVLASVMQSSFAWALQLWAEASGKSRASETAFLQISLQAYEDLWGKWGTEMGANMAFWGAVKERSWSVGHGQVLLRAADLGLSEKDFVMPEEAWKGMDWSAV